METRTTKCPHCGSPAPAFSTICKSCGSRINVSKTTGTPEEALEELKQMSREIPETLQDTGTIGKRTLLYLLDVCTLGITWLLRTRSREKRKQHLAKTQAVYEQRARFIREAFRGNGKIAENARQVYAVILKTVKQREQRYSAGTMLRVGTLLLAVLLAVGHAGAGNKAYNTYSGELQQALAGNDIAKAGEIVRQALQDNKVSNKSKQEFASRIAVFKAQQYLMGYDFQPGKANALLAPVEKSLEKDRLQQSVDRIDSELKRYSHVQEQ